MRPNEQRQESRVGLEFPAQISIGSQFTVQGALKDLSLKSAFITMRSSIYLQTNDEVGFSIRLAPDDDTKVIAGSARVSRIAVGEGIAIYFTKMDDASLSRLRDLVKP